MPFLTIFQYSHVDSNVLFVLLARVKFSRSRKLYVSSAIIPITSFHISGRHVICCIAVFQILLTEYSSIICHPCRWAIFSHEDVIHLNSNLLLKIAKVLNPIPLNTILPCSFPAGHLSTLFYHLLYTYDHTFLKIFFIISNSFFKSFSHSASQLCPFSTLQISH